MAAMDDSALTEDEMLAQAISLSLGDQELAEGVGRLPDLEMAPAISRSDTNQSQDSLLNDSWATGQGRQISHDTGVTTSVSSSPDLGISAEPEMDSQLEQERREEGDGEPMQACGRQLPMVDGGTTTTATNTAQDGARQTVPSHQLPLARLSSLHDQHSSQGSLPSPVQKEWEPNKQCLELIVGMGISENAAKRALFNTGNDNAELAVAWVFENIENPELHTHFEPPLMMTIHSPGAPMGPGPVFHSIDELIGQLVDEVSYKMVFVVNLELKMSPGKTAAQVGHATLGLYKYLQSQQDQKAGLELWEERGSKKVVLRGDSVRHLLDLKKRAYELHIANIMVHDAGKTEVEPGSLTVFALFGKYKDVDKVTGNLKLL